MTQYYVDHPIGIWVEGAKNFTISGNDVKRCGKKTYFVSRRPCIHVGPKKIQRHLV